MGDKKRDFEVAEERLIELLGLLQSRIGSMAEAGKIEPNWCQARQLIIYYRKLVWETMDALNMERRTL